jgi:hypothetical protein
MKALRSLGLLDEEIRDARCQGIRHLWRNDKVDRNVLYQFSAIRDTIVVAFSQIPISDRVLSSEVQNYYFMCECYIRSVLVSIDCMNLSYFIWGVFSHEEALKYVYYDRYS